MIEIIPNWHPIFVHFTVALIVITGILQILQWLFKNKLNSTSVLSTQKWLVILSSLAIIVTIATGLQAYYSVNHDSPSHLAMTDHRNWAVITGLVFLLGTAFYFFLPKTKNSLAGILFVGAFILVSATAYKGGELVYRYGLGVMSLPVVTGDGHDHDHGTAGAHHQEQVNTNNSTDNGHSDHNHEPELKETTSKVKEDNHSNHDHSHDSEEPKDADDKAKEEHGDHDHSHEQSHDNQAQEFISGLDTDAASAVIAFHNAIISGDADVARAYLEEAVVIFEGGGVERSAEQYASHHMTSDMSFLKELEITTLEHQVKVKGDMALSMSRSKMIGTFKGKDIDITSMETMVLKKIGEQWKIIHIHWSN